MVPQGCCMFPFTTLVSCPRSRAGEWNFRLFGVPVHVKFWFWLSLLLIGASDDMVAVLIWLAVCFVSILIHELGHVLVFRMFGEDAEVVLYAWGGLAVPRRGIRGTLAQFVVSLAGPLAGFGAAGLTLGVARWSGATLHLGHHMFIPMLTAVPALSHGFESHPQTYLYWSILLNDLLFVNFYWGLVNLLPVYPLDGGQATRAVIEQYDPRFGRRRSLLLSAIVAAAVALLGIANHNLYMLVMFGILAAASVQAFDEQPRPIVPRPSGSW